MAINNIIHNKLNLNVSTDCTLKKISSVNISIHCELNKEIFFHVLIIIL